MTWKNENKSEDPEHVDFLNKYAEKILNEMGPEFSFRLGNRLTELSIEDYLKSIE